MIRKSCKGCNSIKPIYIDSKFDADFCCSEISYRGSSFIIPRCPCRQCLVKITCETKCDVFNANFNKEISALYFPKFAKKLRSKRKPK